MQDDFLDKHRRFVLDLAKNDVKLRDLIEDRRRLCTYLKNRLSQITTLPGFENLPNSDPSECESLQAYQLAKIIWLLDSLEMNADFRKRTGEEIESDYGDKKSAHGGAIVFRDNSLRLLMIPNKPVPQGFAGFDKSFENYSYEPIEFEPTPDIMFLFHFHAFEEDNSRFASPTNSDLKEAERRKFDGLVITKIIGTRFNVDYYFVGRDDENRPFDVVLDLGVYEY